MKIHIIKTVFRWGILGSLLLIPITSSALNTFNTETGYLAIPEVKVNDNIFYDNVGIKLNFTTGTFELVSGDARPETGTNPGGISTTPIESDSLENVLKLDFMGCERSNNGSVICHVLFTSLGGIDREVRIMADGAGELESKLYDSNGTVHISKEVTFANLTNSYPAEGVTILLVSGIPTLAQYKFYNVSPERSLSLFKPAFRIYNEYYASSFHKF